MNDGVEKTHSEPVLCAEAVEHPMEDPAISLGNEKRLTSVGHNTYVIPETQFPKPKEIGISKEIDEVLLQEDRNQQHLDAEMRFLDLFSTAWAQPDENLSNGDQHDVISSADTTPQRRRGRTKRVDLQQSCSNSNSAANGIGEARYAWQLGQVVGMHSAQPHQVISALRRSQRKNTKP